MSQYASYPSLEGRSVFITGGGSGIGASLVRHFAAQGSKVGFVDIAVAPSRELVDGIAARGDPEPLFIECDLRDIARCGARSTRSPRRTGRSPC